MGLPRTLGEYREKWEPRLLSDSKEERERAIRELIREGLQEFAPDLKEAAGMGVHLVYVFSHALEADTPLIGYFVRSGLGTCSGRTGTSFNTSSWIPVCSGMS